MSVERDYSSRDASVSYSGSSDMIDYTESDPPSSTRSRLGPVKTFSAALLDEFNGPARPREERRKLLLPSRSFQEDRGHFSKWPSKGRKQLPWSRSVPDWDLEEDFMPPLRTSPLHRSVSYQDSSYRSRRRTPPPSLSAPIAAPIAQPREITVIVENLPEEYKPKDVRRLFLPFGNVDQKIRLSSGVARVTFTDLRSADDCVKTLHGYPLSGKRLSLKFI